MARRFQSNRFRTSQRRKTDWIGGVVGTSTRTTVGASVVAILSSFDTRISTNQIIGATTTIVRIRGLLDVGPIGLTADMDAQGAFGFCIVNGEAFDAGVASVPTPWTESFDDRWLYHTYWSVHYELPASGSFVGQSFVQEIDSKAMRKMNNGDVLIGVIENANAGDNVSVFMNVRTLLKLA